MLPLDQFLKDFGLRKLTAYSSSDQFSDRANPMCMGTRIIRGGDLLHVLVSSSKGICVESTRHLPQYISTEVNNISE